MSERDAVERPRVPWPTLVVVGLALFGAVTLVQWVLGLAFTLVKLAIVVAVVAAVVLFFRGPPD